MTGGRGNALVSAAVVRPSLLILQVEREELAAHFDRRHVDEVCERAVRHRDPLLACRTVAAGNNRFIRFGELQRRHLPGRCIDLDAVDVYERMRVDDLAIGPIEQIEVSVTVRLGKRLRHDSSVGEPHVVEQHRLIDAVVIPDVVRRELKVPLDLPSVRVKREH